jgi:hypothetical protein
MLKNLLCMGFSSEPVVFASSSQFIDPANFPFVDVQDRDQRQRESVEIRVGVVVACVLSENQTLEVATAFVFFV